MPKEDADIPLKRKSGGGRGWRGRIKKNYWAVKIALITLIVSGGISFVAEVLLGSVPLLVAILILIALIALGIVFDIIGIAATAAGPKPFLAMASKKVHGAQQCVFLLQHTDQVASFCNDVVGDVCGIVSGAASAAIVLRIVVLAPATPSALLNIIISSVVAALTVGGKAAGKRFALVHSTNILLRAGRVLAFFHIGRQKHK